MLNIDYNVRALIMLGLSRLILFSALAPAVAFAGPGGGHVIAGRGTIGKPNTQTTVVKQQSNRLVVDWSSFNVAPNEQVTFKQPSAKAAALNRIFDQQPSRILGKINANGKVFLLNPNGILFGRHAHVNVGSLFATSLKIKPDDFMAGRLRFSAPPGQDGGPIINHGLISASGGGSVNLFGGRVANSGLIIADLGEVNLAAGHAATVDFDGDGLIRFQINGKVLHNMAGAKAAVSNTGRIEAPNGRVLMRAATAKTIFKNAVNNSGVVAARGIERHGGKIRLVGAGGGTVNSGDLDASATGARASGGAVTVSGDNVAQTGRISVDAGQSGAGGKVGVVAKDTAIMSGHISARGGAEAGAGGFAEVSAQRHLTVSGHADLRAPHGQAGRLLLDPGTVNVCHLGDSCSASRTGDDTFSDDYINTQLGLGDVLITTAGADHGNGSRPNIDFLDNSISIKSDSGNSLGLVAGNAIRLQGTIELAGSDSSGNPATLELSAPSIVNRGALTLGGDVNANQALNFANPLHLDSAVRLDTSQFNGSEIDAPVTLGEVDGPGSLVIATGSGDVSLGTLGSDQPLGGLTVSSSGTTSLHGGITTAGGDIGFDGAVQLANDVVLSTTGGDMPGANIAFGGAVDGAAADAQTLALSAGAGDIDFAAQVGGAAPPKSLIINDANNVTAAANLAVGSLAQLAGQGLSRFDGLIVTSDPAGIHFTGHDIALMGGVTTTAGGSATIANGGTLTLAGVLHLDGAFTQIGTGETALNADLDTSAANITFSGPVNLGAGVRVDTGAGAGDISFGSGAPIDGGHALTLAAGTGEVTLAAPVGELAPLGGLNVVSASAVQLSANIATGGGPIRFAAPVVVDGSVALDTTQGAPAGADIDFAAPLDALGAGAADLTLSAGSGGNIDFEAPVGATAPLGAVAIDSAHDVGMGAFNAASLTQLTGTGTTRFNGAVQTSGAAGIALAGNNFVVTAPVATDSGGAVKINNTGSLTILQNAPLHLSGGFAQTGSGPMSLASSIDTADGGISAASPLSLAEGADLALSATGGDIALMGGANGTAGGSSEKLTLKAKAGSVTVGPVGTGAPGGLADLTVASADAVDYAGPIALGGALTQTAAGGLTRFAGDVSVALATLDGVDFSVLAPFVTGGSLTVHNSGVFQIGAGAPVTAKGGFSINGAVSAASDVTTMHTPLVVRGGLSVAGDAGVTFNTNSGDMELAGPIQGGSSASLTLDAGAGRLALGSASGLDRLTLSASGPVELSGALAAGSLDMTNLSGALTTAGAASLKSADSVIDLSHAAGIDAAASGGALTIDAGAGAVRLAPVGATAPLNRLTVTGGSIALDTVTTRGAQRYNGATTLTGDIEATGQGDLTFAGPVVLAGSQLRVQTANGNIHFDGAVDGAHALAVDAGLGKIGITGAVGDNMRLAALALSGGRIELNGDVATLGAQTYTGATRLGGNLSGASLTFNGTLQVPLAAALTADKMTFNGGPGSVAGSAPLAIQPMTAGMSVSLGSGNGLSLASAPLAGYAGPLAIGGLGPNFSTMTPRAGRVVVNDNLELGSAGSLTLIGTDGIVLKHGTIGAGDLNLLAASQEARILNSGGAGTRLSGNRIILVAGGNVGAGLGQEINAKALGDHGVMQIASGGDTQAFIVNINNSLNVITGFAATEAIELAHELGLAINTDQTVTNAGQVTALRQQTAKLSGTIFVDPALFRDISLYDITGAGILLPADQRETGGKQQTTDHRRGS